MLLQPWGRALAGSVQSGFAVYARLEKLLVAFFVGARIQGFSTFFVCTPKIQSSAFVLSFLFRNLLRLSII
jgi:hypothetical protein